MSHPAASRIPLYIGEVYKPCVSGLFLDDIRLATCPVESHRVGLSDASHNTLDTQPLFKFFLMSSDSEALFDTLMNELIHQMSGQTAPLGNGRPRDFPATDPAPDSTLLIVYSLLIIESRDAGFARRNPEESRRENRSNGHDMLGAPVLTIERPLRYRNRPACDRTQTTQRFARSHGSSRVRIHAPTEAKI